MMKTLLRRLSYVLQRRRYEADLQEEIETHRALRQEQLEASGMSAAEAARASRRALGNTTLSREDARTAWLAPGLDSVWQDARYGLRRFKQAPGATLASLSVLVVVMGLTTSLFTAVDAALLRPWPVPEPASLVALPTEWHPVDGRTRAPTTVYGAIPAVEFRFIRERARTVAVMAMTTESIAVREMSSRVDVRFVSGNYFALLGTPIALGRGIGDGDDALGLAMPAVVISHDLWHRLNADPQILGRVLHFDEGAFSIVGVAAPGATDSPLERSPHAWMALSAKVLQGEEKVTGCCVTLAGRLADGFRHEAATAEVRALAGEFARMQGGEPTTISVTSTAFVNQPQASRAVQTMSLFSAAIVLILLLGCANVGNLQLARGLTRQREMAIRLSLGSTRARLIRLLLVEGALLALLAGGVSLIVAAFLPRWLLAGRVPPGLDLAPDSRTLLFAFSLALATTVMTTLAPALRSTRVGLAGRAGRTSSVRLRGLLLGVQVAICTVLLVATALLGRGLQHAAGPGLGFAPRGVTAISVTLPADADAAARRHALQAALNEASARGELAPVAATNFAPLTAFRTVDVPRGAGATLNAVRHVVSPRYFDVLGLRFERGRAAQLTPAADEIVVNHALTAALWPDQNPLGRTLVLTSPRRVVGVVADAQTESVGIVRPTIYEPADSARTLLIRGSESELTRLTSAVTRLEPAADVTTTPLTAGLRAQLDLSIIGAAIAGSLSLIALLLATVGTAGVVSFMVEERKMEIGVRMALGATARNIVRFIGDRLARPLGAGLVAGLLIAQGLGAILRAQLFGVSGHDAVAQGVAGGVLALAAFLAVVGPIRRAIATDPIAVLKAE